MSCNALCTFIHSYLLPTRPCAMMSSSPFTDNNLVPSHILVRRPGIGTWICLNLKSILPRSVPSVLILRDAQLCSLGPLAVWHNDIHCSPNPDVSPDSCRQMLWINLSWVCTEFCIPLVKGKEIYTCKSSENSLNF